MFSQVRIYFIITQDGTKMYFRMTKAAENYFLLMTQFSLKFQWLILSSPHQEASAFSMFLFNANSTALETHSVSYHLQIITAVYSGSNEQGMGFQ